jgi:hypothetical protein
VQVVIDESGRVISAVPVSGHPLLKAAAAEAAKRSTFSATKMSGQPVKVYGIITYNFQSAQDPQVAVGELAVAETTETPETTTEKAPEPPTPDMIAEAARIEREAKLRQLFAEKFHFWIFAAVERMRGGSAAPALHEETFVTQGMANIEIVFAARTPETIEKLKALGMRVTMIKGALRAEGIIPAEKLAELAVMEEVKLVLPKMR